MAETKEINLTQSELHKLFRYENGVLYCKVQRRKAKVGDVAGFIHKKNGYASLCINYNQYYIHRLVWIMFNGSIDSNKQIDHINSNRSDNRIENLREVTVQENKFNISQAKGYSWHRLGKKWSAQIKVNRKKIHLGLFNTTQEARDAYLEAKKVYHTFEEV